MLTWLAEFVTELESPAPRIAPERGLALRVLVVEDERRLAENIARSLRESAGYAVDLALDGEEGLYMAQTNPYDLILLDLMIPKIDGLTLVKKLRSGGGDVP